jgi:hypothetical protein
VKRKAKKLARKSLPLVATIPGAGAGLKEFGTGFITDKSWEAVFESYGTEIKTASAKIVVIVDDLDRLQPTELLHVLKIIRLLGRLPRVQYLLAYDRNALVSALRQGLRASHQEAESFIEKIVQYPLSVPPAQEVHLRQILAGELSGALGASPADVASQADARFWDFYDRFMRQTLVTVRSVKRFAAQASVYFKLVHGEVDAADFLALTFMRMEHPKLYEKLRSWKPELLGLAAHPLATQKAADWDARFKELGYPSMEQQDLARSMLTDIFPAVASGRPHVGWGTANASKADYFDRYFFFSIPELDVADTAVTRDFQRLTTSTYPGQNRFPDTFDHPNGDVGRLAIQKALRHSETSSNPKHHERVVRYLASAMSREEPTRGSYNPRLLAQTDWLKSSLKRILNPQADLDWPLFARLFEGAAVEVARVVVDIVDEFEGDSLPTHLQLPVPEQLSAFRSEVIVVLAGKLTELASVGSYDGRTREFLDLYGSLWRIASDAEFHAVGAGLLSSGIAFRHLLGWFVYPGHYDGGRFVFDEDGPSLHDLDLEKLEMLFGATALLETPIEEESSPTPAERARQRQLEASEGLKRWRLGRM